MSGYVSYDLHEPRWPTERKRERERERERERKRDRRETRNAVSMIYADRD